VPTGLLAAPGDNQVTLSWEPVTDSDRAFYRVYGRTAGGAWTKLQRADTESATVTGLTNGTAYRFAVSAVDTNRNESHVSVAASATPVAPDTTPPPTPSGLSAAASDHAVTFSWNAVAAPDLAGYLVYYRESGETVWSAPVRVSAIQVTLGDLANGTTYEFSVASVDRLENESTRSDIVTATPHAPPLAVVTGLVASPGDGRVDLQWAPSNDPRLMGYRVEMRVLPDGAWSQVPDGLTTGSDVGVPDLTNGVSYAFAVTALSDDGYDSARSDAVTATPEAPTP
jgi:hypothetical protein